MVTWRYTVYPYIMYKREEVNDPRKASKYKYAFVYLLLQRVCEFQRWHSNVDC